MKNANADNKKNKKAMGKGELLLAAAVLAAALICFAVIKLTNAGAGEAVVVQAAGKECARLPLNEDTVLDIPSEGGHINVLVIESGAAYISESDCENQVCVNTWKISKEGELIVCLPHKVIVSIESDR